MAEKKRSPKSWGRFLVKYAVFLLVIGLAACVLLYFYAAQYEETRPELVIEKMMDETAEDGRYELLSENLPTESFVFEDPSELYKEYYDAALADADLRYRIDMAAGKSDETVFVIYTGPVKVCNVYLSAIPGTRTFFGRSQWQLERIETADFRDYLETFSIEIDAPADAEVTVNGVALSDEYMYGDAIACPNLTELESRFPVQPTFVRYRIDKLCGTVAVSDGEKEIPTETGIVNGVAYYAVDAEGEYSFKAEAPADVKVSICGVELSSKDATSEGEDIFKDLSVYSAGDEYKTLEYEYDGLYTKPEVTAVGPNGEPIEPVVDQNGVFRFFYDSDAEIPDGAEEAARDFFDAYMNYSASTGSVNSLLDTILPNTELARYVLYSTEAMYWASKTEVSYNELFIDNFHSVNDACFTCTIRYSADFTATAWYEQYSYDMQNGYKMVFVRNGGKWLAASMCAF